MNNNIDKKKALLLNFQISSENSNGGSTEYRIMEDGTIRLDVAYGYMLPSGPTKLRVEDHLSEDEVLMVRRFIHSEMAEEEYESISAKGIEYTLQSPDRKFVDCPQLTEKFMKVLNQIAEGHPVISRNSINPICHAMEAQAAKQKHSTFDKDAVVSHM